MTEGGLFPGAEQSFCPPVDEYLFCLTILLRVSFVCAGFEAREQLELRHKMDPEEEGSVAYNR